MNKKEENKISIIFIILFSITFILFIIGLISYYNGYGKHGIIRKELIPIIEKYNDLNKNKAKYKDDSIQIETENKTYNFKYKEENNIKYISLEYNSSESNYIEEISKDLIESISILNGNKKENIFDKYTYEELYATKLENDSIQINNNSGKITISIEINKNILNEIENDIIDSKNKEYITPIEIRNIKEQIDNKTRFNYIKNNIYMYVSYNVNEKEYTIYITKNNYSKESIMSIIYILNYNTYKYINNEEEFNTNKQTDKYTIEINPILPLSIPYTNQEYIKITLKK